MEVVDGEQLEVDGTAAVAVTPGVGLVGLGGRARYDERTDRGQTGGRGGDAAGSAATRVGH